MNSDVIKDFSVLMSRICFSIHVERGTGRIVVPTRSQIMYYKEDVLPVGDSVLNKIVAVGFINIRMSMFGMDAASTCFRELWTYWDLIKSICNARVHELRENGGLNSLEFSLCMGVFGLPCEDEEEDEHETCIAANWEVSAL